MAKQRNGNNCEAKLASSSCLNCEKFGKQVVDSTLKNLGLQGPRLGVVSEDVTHLVSAVLTTEFPANYVVAPEFAGQISCNDRRNRVQETAQDLAELAFEASVAIRPTKTN